MQVQFQRLAGHGQWSWRQWFGAWGLSCNLKWIRQRKHNTKCRDSEVHQHIPALSRIRTKCGKCLLGSNLFTCPLVMLKVSARLDLKIWADLPSCCRAPSVGTRTSCDLYWRFPNRFGSSPQRSIYTKTKIHLNWRVACQVNASLENFVTAKLVYE